MTAKRVDANQAQIVAGWRAVGALVVLTHRQGGNVPDAFVYFRRRWTAHELKSSDGTLTPGQRDLQARWPGAVYVTRSMQEGLDQIGAECYGAEEAERLPPRRPVRITSERKEQAR